MSKFKNSKESFSSNIYLWYDRPTQVGIRETYDIKIWPITNIYNDGPIQFLCPEQTKGMLQDIHINAKTRLKKGGLDIVEPKKDVSVVNNFANSLWGQVDVQFDDRLDVTQSMRNAYAYKTFFNHALNSDSSREDFLLYNELFRMDQGKTKMIEEKSRIFWKWNDEIDDKIVGMIPEDATDKEAKLERVKELLWTFNRRFYAKSLQGVLNELGTFQGDDLTQKLAELRDLVDIAYVKTTTNTAASDRSHFINSGKSVTVDSKLQCPIFNTSKCLPHNTRIRIHLPRTLMTFFY